MDNRMGVMYATGLRVLDANLLTRMPTVHPSGPVYVFAKRAGDLNKAGWLEEYRSLGWVC